ncbi:MAG TPA: tandem-95 repeat protein, partial [Methanosarcinaceae archaeon]|nr:tandem-95 repeat protein [Methanosarcinaceae archaeon]
MNSIIILVLTSAVFLLFVIPVDLSNNTDDLWINHTLGNDSDNLTDSYSVNINGVEYNEPTSTYYNVTDLDPHEFSNITEFALNNSEKGSFSAFPSSQIKQGLILGNSNSAPVAVDDNYSVNEDSDFNVIAPGILANDTDSDSSSLNAVLADSTTNGTLTLNTNGSFSYTPNSNFNGVDSFTYKANDSYDDSNIATVTITVNPVNDAPVAVGDSYSMVENTVLSVIEPGILINDNDLENNPLNAVLADSTTNGNLILNTNGSFSYTPNSNFNGVDSFTYKANDSYDDSNIATVTITVNPVNDAPVAVGDSYSMVENTVLSVIEPGILINDNDLENNPLNAVLADSTTNGNLILNTNGSFSYTPNSNFNGV